MNKQPYVLRFIMQHGKFPTKNNEEYQIRNPRQNLIYLWWGICFTALCLSTNFVILSYRPIALNALIQNKTKWALGYVTTLGV